MRQIDIHENVVEPLISGMNLAEVKIYSDREGVREAVLLKYVDPHYGTGRDERHCEIPRQ